MKFDEWERENQKLLLDLTFQMIRTQQQQKWMETEKIYYRNHNNTLNEQMKNATFTTKNLWLSNHTKPWVLHKDYLRERKWKTTDYNRKIPYNYIESSLCATNEE